jgi:hypothetical protein
MHGARESDARLDDLRRRLYGPQATEDDVARYAAEREARQPAAPAPRIAAPRSRRTALLAGGVLLAGGALALGVRLLQPASARSAAVRAAQDLGDGEGDPTKVSGRSSVAASIDGTSVVGHRTQGYGNAVVPFDAPDGSFDGGRAMVAVTSTGPTRVGWQAIRRVTRQDWSAYPVVMASGSAQDRSGAHAPTVFGYATRPPDLVVIRAPADIGWTLVTAVTTRTTAGLR